ncbi:MAG: M43 family zinc metalloprotease [Ferruginibacter sp.]
MKSQLYMQKLFLLLLGFVTMSAAAQKRFSCGPQKIDTAFLLSMVKLERNPGYTLTNTTRMVKVFIHILCDDDGGAQAITMDQAKTEFASLVADYAGNNLCFFLGGIDTIHSNHLNNAFEVEFDDPSDFDPYQVPSCVNVFYVLKIVGNNNSCNPPCGYGGIALGGIPGTFCLVDNDNVGQHSIAHEVGHCLGLSHTFAAINGKECINGSNSLTAGDLIADTHADPFSFDGSSCYSETSNGCSYTGHCQDPCGATNYSPPYTNLMSYWPACSTQFFTAGQFTRVNNTVDNYIPIVACASPSTLTQNAVSVSSGFLIRAAINSFSTNGTVTITASAVASFGGTEAVFTPGFRAAPSGLGSTTGKVTGCN